MYGRTEVGAWFDRTLFTDSDALVVLRSRVAWAHDGGSRPTLSAAYNGLPDTTFTVHGIKPVSDSLLVSAGVDLRRGNWLLSAKFDGELADGSRSYAGTGVLRYTW